MVPVAVINFGPEWLLIKLISTGSDAGLSVGIEGETQRGAGTGCFASHVG
jgi:hypothetical protein